MLSQMYIGLHVRYLFFLSDFNETWTFAADFRKKKTQISNVMKFRSVGAELFHVDRQTDVRTYGETDGHDEANSCFFAILRTYLKVAKK
jgi:hypothetical protein